MNGKTAKAVRKVVREAERNRIAPAVEAVARYSKSTEERVSELELSMHTVLGWKTRGLLGRLRWLVTGR